MRQLLSILSLVAILQSIPSVVYAQAQPAAKPVSDPIQQVLAAKLMTAYPDGNFHPEGIVSRAEIASILVKAFGLDQRAGAQQKNLVPVQDVPQNYWAYNDIQVVLKTGIMKGYRGDMFFPNQKINRAEAFSIIAQAYGVFQFPNETVKSILTKYPDAQQVPDWAEKSMATALYVGLVNTDEQGSILPLNPMTRGDLAYALSQYLQQQQPPSAFSQKK